MSGKKAIALLSMAWGGVVLLTPAFSAEGEVSRPAQKVLIEKVVAVVNDEIITLTELQEAARPFLHRTQMARRGEDLQAGQQQILENLILQRLQLQEARKQGLSASPPEVASALEDLKRQNNIKSDEELKMALGRERLTLGRLKKGLEEQIILAKLASKEIRSKVIITEEEIKRYYEENRERFKRAPEVKLRHIFIAVPKEAPAQKVEAAKKRAEEALSALQGGADFAEVAKAYSDGPTAKEGGELGRMKREDLHPELAKAAFELPLGGVSGLIRTPAGFNIIQVEERTADPSISLTEVKESIRAALFEEKAHATMKEWLSTLKAKASIEVKGW